MIQNILNLVACSLSSALGTGTYGCKFFFKKLSVIWLLPQGFALDPTRTLDDEYIQELQASGNLIVLRNIDNVTPETSDDTIDASEDGREQIASLGYYKFSITFIQGLYFHTALHSISGYGNYDALFIDKSGNILGTSSTNNSLKGFTLGMHQAAPIQWASSATGQREGYAIQLTERSEVDKNYFIIEQSQLGNFNPLSIDGVNEVELSFVNAPADTDTTLTIQARRKQDGAAFTGVNYQNFRLLVDGVESSPTAGDDTATTGVFVLTVPAISTDEELSISLYDDSNNRIGVLVDTRIYKSNSLITTVV